MKTITSLMITLLLISAGTDARGAEGIRVKPHPKGYVACKAPKPLTIDGKLSEPSWRSAPWTDDFVDIEGSLRPLPRFRTRAKMLWDDTYLYIGAELQEPHVWATLTKRDTVIFIDNDFEVFIDPNGDNHEYYEFEMNARNTVWDLFLPKPYKDRGSAVDAWNIDGLKTAVHVRGTLSDPVDTDSGWSVEIAMPWSALKRFAHRPAPPKDGDQWRINFSRVEWLHEIVGGSYRKVAGRREDNWVWSPQWVIDMHRPETWGYLQFSSLPQGKAVLEVDPAWEAKCALHEVYYAQRVCRDSTNAWAATLDQLRPWLPAGFTVPGELTFRTFAEGFVASLPVSLPDGTARRWNIGQDSRLWDDEPGGETPMADDHGLTIIPRVEQCSRAAGEFSFTPATRILVLSPGSGKPFAPEYFAQRMRSVTGLPLPVQVGRSIPHTSCVVFEFTGDGTTGKEGYQLEVSKNLVHVRAGTDAGHFYAVQTLFQLLPEVVFGTIPVRDARRSLPCLTIRDTPRFPWRGTHLDVSRHFLSGEFIKRFLDMLAMHKINVFHWHLTDDQGWRIEIRKYPLLTKVGAWRADREGIHWNVREPQRPGEPAAVGGFYTQDEIREIVRYARERHITIVPEIEMPAHTTAALAAYPQFSCTGGPFRVTTGALWPITDIFCAGNDSTFLFLQDVLTEVMDLFPGTYVHIGGDEADKTNWKSCPKCQGRIKAEGLADVNELQSYFIKRVEKFVVAKQRRLIGWDEILEGGLAPEATVMSWRGMDGGREAARLGHDVVMTPGSHTYFNSYQGRPEFEPPAGGGYLPLGKVYSFEPVPEDLTSDQAAHILGGQSCLWGEFIPNARQAEYMMLPRLAAMSEVLWSQKHRRDPRNFFGRIETQMRRYGAAGYACATSVYSVTMTSVLDTAMRQALVSLMNESGETPIHYTLDGTPPGAASPRYAGPFLADRPLEILAVSVKNGEVLSAPTRHRLFVHAAIARPVTLKAPYRKYTGGGPYGLTNGMRGSIDYDDGNWQGYEQDDLEATIDLGGVTDISKITAHFLADHHAWIFAPTAVSFELSGDGKTFTPAGRREFAAPGKAEAASILEVAQPVSRVKARYIRVSAKNLGLCPDWHVGRGGKAWLFVDEIVVD